MKHRRNLATYCTATLIMLAIAATAGGAAPAVQPVPADESTITFVVTSTADSGPGTLRRAMQEAQSGDTITFDPAIFPPNAPQTIAVNTVLPGLGQGYVTIDASDAGVILDGSQLPRDTWVGGIEIGSDGNTVRGLQVVNFTGTGIVVAARARGNTIGGDRSIGAGPTGQGNLCSGNAYGIGLWDRAANNIVTGNLIGTGLGGAPGPGNRSGGMWITEGAFDNVIGPDNIIAYNREAGIELEGFYSVHNTITGNSIHDNGAKGIGTWWGGNGELFPPSIFDFDLQAGTVTGTACYGCVVEIFSDSSDEGAHFEGQTTADARGVFALSKGTPLIGPHLTATATDVDGNTSEFSPPTSGTSRSLTLQQGNEINAIHLQHRPSRELLDNRIGINYADWDMTEYLGHLDLLSYEMGVKWARVAIDAQEPERVDWVRPEMSISPFHDAVFTTMADNGLKMKYLLTFWDKATWPGGQGAPCARFKTEGEIERYLEFVRFIVRHFKDRIEYYELWNEPDIPNYCPKWIEVQDYINLVRRTVPVIREEYPQAKIVVGAVSGLSGPHAEGYPTAKEYLYTLLQSDIMPLVDVVSWHVNGPTPDCESLRDFYYAYPSLVQQIKDLAIANGFDGEFQGNELGYRTPEIAQPGDRCVLSPTLAAKYSGRNIVMHLGMDMRVDLAAVGETGAVGHKLCTAMAGALPAPLPVQIQSSETNIVSYTFSSPNDAYLVALWTNDTAAEYDPGTPATITLSGFVGHSATAIDVLHGFEQQILASEENGNLVIRNLLVKDYPILLRVSPIRHIFLPAVLRQE